MSNNNMLQTLEMLQCEKLKERKLQQLTNTMLASVKKERPHTARKSMPKLGQSKTIASPLSSIDDKHPHINGIKKESDDISKVWETIRKDLKEKQSKTEQPTLKPKSATVETDFVVLSDDDDISIVSYFSKGNKSSQMNALPPNNLSENGDNINSQKPKIINKPLESFKHKIDKFKDPKRNGNSSPKLNQKEGEIKLSSLSHDPSKSLDSTQTIDLCDLDDPEDEKSASSNFPTNVKKEDKNIECSNSESQSNNIVKDQNSACLENNSLLYSGNNSTKINEQGSGIFCKNEELISSDNKGKINMFDSSQTIDLCETEESEDMKTYSCSSLISPNLKTDETSRSNDSSCIEIKDTLTLAEENAMSPTEKATLETKSSSFLKESSIDKLTESSTCDAEKIPQILLNEESKHFILTDAQKDKNLISQSEDLMQPAEISSPLENSTFEASNCSKNPEIVDIESTEDSKSQPKTSLDESSKLSLSDEADFSSCDKVPENATTLTFTPQEGSKMEALKPSLILEKSKLKEVLKNGAGKIMEAIKNEKCKLIEKVKLDLKDSGDKTATDAVPYLSDKVDSDLSVEKDLNENICEISENKSEKIAEITTQETADSEHRQNLSQLESSSQVNKALLEIATTHEESKDSASSVADVSFGDEEQNQSSEADPLTDDFVIIDEVKDEEVDKDEPTEPHKRPNNFSDASDDDEPNLKKLKKSPDKENTTELEENNEAPNLPSKEDFNSNEKDPPWNLTNSLPSPVQQKVVNPFQESPQKDQGKGSEDSGSDPELSTNEYFIIDEVIDDYMEGQEARERKRQVSGDISSEEPQVKKLKTSSEPDEVSCSTSDNAPSFDAAKLIEDIIFQVVKELVDHTVSTESQSSPPEITLPARDHSTFSPQESAINPPNLKASLSEIHCEFEEEDEEPFPALQIVDSVIHMDFSQTSSPQASLKENNDHDTEKNEAPVKSSHSSSIDIDKDQNDCDITKDSSEIKDVNERTCTPSPLADAVASATSGPTSPNIPLQDQESSLSNLLKTSASENILTSTTTPSDKSDLVSTLANKQEQDPPEAVGANQNDQLKDSSDKISPPIIDHEKADKKHEAPHTPKSEVTEDASETKSLEDTIMEIEEGGKDFSAEVTNVEEEPFDHSAITLDFEEEVEKPADISKVKTFTKEDLESLLYEKVNECISQNPLFGSLLKRCQILEKAITRNKLVNQELKTQITLAERRLCKPTCRTVGVNVHINQVPTRTVGVTVSIPSPAPLRQSVSSPLAPLSKASFRQNILPNPSYSKPGSYPTKMASSPVGSTAPPSTTTGVIDLTEEDTSSKGTHASNLIPMHSLVNSIPSLVQLIPSCNAPAHSTPQGTTRTTSLRPSSNITQGAGSRVTTLLVPQVPGQNASLPAILLRMNGPLSSTAVPVTGPNSIVSSRSGTGNQTHVVVSGLYQPATNQPMHILKNSPHPSTLAQTTATASPNMQPLPSLLRHPAPLPRFPMYTEKPGFKLVPPKPQLNLSKVPNGIVLSWTMKVTHFHETIQTYELYAYQETGQPPSTNLWKKVGDVRALPLPMACTLTQFVEGNKYHFAVRAKDNLNRFGPFSDPAYILLTKESATSSSS